MAEFNLIDPSDQLSPSTSMVVHALEFTPAFTSGMVDDTHTIKIGKLPANFTVTGVAARPGDLDASTGLVFDLGTTDDTNAFVNASSAGQTNSGIQSLTSVGLLYTTTEEEEVLVTVTTAATTEQAANGTFVFMGYFS